MDAGNNFTTYNLTESFATHPRLQRLTTLITQAQQTVLTSLGWLFMLGTSTDLPLYKKKNLRLVNTASFMALLMAFPGIFLLMLLGFSHTISVMVFGVLTVCLVLGLNGAKKTEEATAIFAFSPAGSIALFSLIELGSTSGADALVLILSRQALCLALLLPILMYGYEERRKVSIVSAVCVVIYLVYEVGSMRLGAYEGQNITGLEHGLFSMFSVIQYATLAASILYVQNYARQQELKIPAVNQKMQRLAIRDGLTGLYNHAFMEEMIGDAINRSKRSRNPLALLMIDVDYFKQVNDTFGHNAGDDVLKELIQVLKSNKRSTDYLGRWGGDELLMLLTDTNLTGAANLSEKLRQLVADHLFPHCKHLTISLGAGEYQAGDSPLGFVERADAAMYRAKRGGRNRSANAAPGN
jgi:diguanylate cyclase (GGDEF)-like protein